MHSAAEVPRVQLASSRNYSEFAGERAAQAVDERRPVGSRHASVGDCSGVRAQLAAVASEEACELGAADLLLSFEDADDIDGQAAARSEIGLERFEMR